MKRKVFLFFSTIGGLLSYLFPLSLLSNLNLLSVAIRSGYIKRNLRSYGKNLKINRPFYHDGLNLIDIGDNFYSFPGLRLEAISNHLGYTFIPKLIIGNNVSINHDCHIGCINNIVIGNNVLIASRVFISDHFHGLADADSIKLPPSERKVVSKGPVIIEDNVWIGEGVVIMPGVTVGKNSIIGANAVVTKSFSANSVIGGNPARLIKIIE